MTRKKGDIMRIEENVSLKAYNTFGIEVVARYFSTFSSEDELRELLNYASLNQLPILVLGGGSNILFTQNFEGLVLHNTIKGIETENTGDATAIVRAGAGEQWHSLVSYAIRHGLGGIENLSLIPGTVGAAPIQNIGAYGAELKDSFEYLEAIRVLDGSAKKFTRQECDFGYRDSIFKTSLKNQYIVTRVALLLHKNALVNTSYGAISSTLAVMNVTQPTIQSVSEAVITIRQSKLPDPQKLGNAGSFFKNPEIAKEQFEELRKTYPLIPFFHSANGLIKIPAGWLIEQCGWKGRVKGRTGVHKDQALVLVNYGDASGLEIKALSDEIRQTVWDKFGIGLIPEVNIL